MEYIKHNIFQIALFMEAELSSNHSYVWRSLLEVRAVIQEGSRQRVGNGWKIKVANLKWIPNPMVFRGCAPSSMKTRELTDEDTKQWNHGKIHALFAPSIRKEFLAIPLTKMMSRDFLVWQENKINMFFVKTAYQVALRLNQQPSGENLEHNWINRHGKRCGC